MTRKGWVVVAIAALGLLVVAGAGGYALAYMRTAKPKVAQASRSPRSTPSTTPSSVPSIEAAPSPTPLTCRIALAGAERGSGGSVTLPDGAYTVDPASNVSVKVVSDTGGEYDQTFGLSYDNARSTWLPVARDWVSPDGAAYAYTVYSGGNDIYIKQVGSGATREIGLDHKYSMLGWLPSGIYTSFPDETGDFTGALRGLTRIDPTNGHGTELTRRGAWQVFSDTAALGIDAFAPYTEAIPTKLLYADLRTGGVSEWFDSKGLRVRPLALDSSGAALVMASNSVVIEIWRVTGPGAATRIYNAGASSDALQPSGEAVTDGDRVWLGSNQGLIMYSEADGLKVVSKATGHPAGQCH